MHNAVPRAPATEEITIASLQQYMRELCALFVQQAREFTSLEQAVSELDRQLCKQISILGINLPFGEEPAHLQIIDDFLAHHYAGIKQEYIPAIQNKVKTVAAAPRTGFLGWNFPSLPLPAVFRSRTNENSGAQGYSPTL